MRISLVSTEQTEQLVGLLQEINAYYYPDSPAPEADVRAHAVDNLLSPTSPHRLVVATSVDGQIIGLAAVTLMFSLVEPEPARRRQCHLKELYVSSRHRNKGVGRALMAWVAAFAVNNGCHRIDWPVQATNAKGLAFYRSLGAVQLVERLSHRLTGAALAQLAAAASGSKSGA